MLLLAVLRIKWDDTCKCNSQDIVPKSHAGYGNMSHRKFITLYSKGATFRLDSNQSISLLAKQFKISPLEEQQLAKNTNQSRKKKSKVKTKDSDHSSYLHSSPIKPAACILQNRLSICPHPIFHQSQKGAQRCPEAQVWEPRSHREVRELIWCCHP